MSLFIITTIAAAAATFAAKPVASNGAACGKGSITAQMSADGQLTLGIPDLAVEVRAPKKFARGLCQVIVDIKHPDNMSAVIGTAQLTSTGSGEVKVTTYEQGSTGQTTRCGDATTLIVKTAIVLKLEGKTAVTSPIKIPLTWGKCVKTTHN